MKSELIIDVHPDEIAIALTEDGRLQEINREKRDQDNFAVGNIYYGRVRKVMPALNAVFVDVGYEKEAFLHYLDLGAGFRTLQKFITRTVSDRRRLPSMRSIERQPACEKDGQIADVLHVGDTLLVQVTKEPINTKGPRLTAEISIAGRNMVLIPFGEKVLVSNKIRRDSERNRLRKLVQSVKPQGYGVIVRTIAQGAELEELDSELNMLVHRWEETLRIVQTKEPVALVREEVGRTTGIIRDMFSSDFADIWVNEQSVYDEIFQYISLIAPDRIKVVHKYTGEQPIFDHFDITRQLKTGLGRTVGFKNGGYLIIDKTEALFSIDVNSGSKKVYEDQEQNAFHYNMLAAEELVHQLRLRDIGGIIIVDFIDMDDKDHQQQLFDYMRQLMSRDRARHNILPLSKFGLMQITRQRVRPAVEVDVTEVCPTCQGKGRIQSSVLFTEQLDEDIQIMYRQYGKGLRLHVHPYVYAYASKGLVSQRLKWWFKYGILLRENQALGMLEYHFVDAKGLHLHVEHTHSSANDKIERALKVEVQSKPQPKPDPKPQPKPEPKPQPKPELQPKPEPKLQPKPEPKPQPKAEPKLQPKPESKPEPKLQPKPEPKPQPKPESKPQPKPEPKPQPKPEPKTDQSKQDEPKATKTKKATKKSSKSVDKPLPQLDQVVVEQPLVAPVKKRTTRAKKASADAETNTTVQPQVTETQTPTAEQTVSDEPKTKTRRTTRRKKIEQTESNS